LQVIRQYSSTKTKQTHSKSLSCLLMTRPRPEPILYISLPFHLRLISESNFLRRFSTHIILFSIDDYEDVFRADAHRRLLDLVTLRTLEKDAAASCKISAYFYQTIRHHNQETVIFILYLIFRKHVILF
jgi:hypothetical protein